MKSLFTTSIFVGLLCVAAQAADSGKPATPTASVVVPSLAEELAIKAEWTFVEDVSFSTDVGPDDSAEVAELKRRPPRAMPAAWPRERDGITRVVAIDIRGQKSYVTELPDDVLSRLGELAQESRLTAASLSGEGEFEGEVLSPRTWSNGVDTRTRRAIADGYSKYHWPYRTIGRLSNNCTGTLVGPRHVLTAAHCIFRQNAGASATKYATFAPRQNGNTKPWGTRKPIWYWVPAQYYDGTCTTTGNCNKYDIGLIVLEKWTGSHPGWMGYGSAAGSSLNQWNFYMRGYPTCTHASAPTDPDGGCTSSTLYGDTQTCDFGTYFSQDASGWSREVTFDCDGSPGQSGSALYTYDSGLGGVAVFGEYSQYACTAGNCANNSYPNTMTRLTPSYRNVITWFRDQCPSRLSNCSF